MSKKKRRERDEQEVQEDQVDVVPATVKQNLLGVMNLESPEVDQDRITVNFSFTHQHGAEEATSFQRPFSRVLTGREQVYTRRLNVPAGGKLLLSEGCWVSNPGYVIVENRKGLLERFTPSAEKMKEIKKHVLVINGMLVQPGQFIMFQPDEGLFERLVVASKYGEIPITLWVINE